MTPLSKVEDFADVARRAGTAFTVVLNSVVEIFCRFAGSWVLSESDMVTARSRVYPRASSQAGRFSITMLDVGARDEDPKLLVDSVLRAPTEPKVVALRYLRYELVVDVSAGAVEGG